jgi:hypothetical protein
MKRNEKKRSDGLQDIPPPNNQTSDAFPSDLGARPRVPAHLRHSHTCTTIYDNANGISRSKTIAHRQQQGKNGNEEQLQVAQTTKQQKKSPAQVTQMPPSTPPNTKPNQ